MDPRSRMVSTAAGRSDFVPLDFMDKRNKK